MSKFSEYWKGANYGVEKSKLTKAEIDDIREAIGGLQKRGYPSSKIITALQKFNPKLKERWKAERVYWTESKRIDTDVVAEAGDDLGISEYKVILSPNACKTCRQKTDGGRKVFKQADIEKAGYGHQPPFHPNCYCILIPKG